MKIYVAMVEFCDPYESSLYPPVKAFMDKEKAVEWAKLATDWNHNQFENVQNGQYSYGKDTSHNPYCADMEIAANPDVQFYVEEIDLRMKVYVVNDVYENCFRSGPYAAFSSMKKALTYAKKRYNYYKGHAEVVGLEIDGECVKNVLHNPK